MLIMITAVTIVYGILKRKMCLKPLYSRIVSFGRVFTKLPHWFHAQGPIVIFRNLILYRQTQKAAPYFSFSR